MYLEDAFRLLVRSGFHCMQIQVNMSDTGFNVGSIVRDLDDAETRFMVIVPDTQAKAMVVGNGNLKVMLEKLVGRVKRGTICNIPLIPVRDKRQAWRVLALDTLYLFLDDGVIKKDFPILSERMEGYNDETEDDEEDGQYSECESVQEVQE